jgi:hypothetical protein
MAYPASVTRKTPAADVMNVELGHSGELAAHRQASISTEI